MLKNLINNIKGSYLKLDRKIFFSIGYVPEEEAIRVFGGIPQYNDCGFVGESCNSALTGREYVGIKPYFNTYKKIVEVARKGEDKMILTPNDLGGENGCFARFCILENLKKKTEHNCLMKNLELKFSDTA